MMLRPGKWMVYRGKRGILHLPWLEVRDPATGALLKRDPTMVQFHVVADDRTTAERLTVELGEFVENARAAGLLEIPEASRPTAEQGATLGYF
jgi:hypothetical protein